MAVVLLAGCRFDDDAAYFPAVKSVYIWMTDAKGVKSVARVAYSKDSSAAPTLNATWLSDLKIPFGSLTDMAPDGKLLWLFSRQGDIFKIDLAANALAGYYGINGLDDNYKAHFACASEKYLVVADSSKAAPSLLFIRKKDAVRQSVVSLALRPSGHILYRSGKWYVPMRDSVVGVFSEAAFALIDTVHLPYKILSLQNDPTENVVAVMKSPDGKTLAANINYLTNSLSETKTYSAETINISPYKYAPYGVEWISNVVQVSEKLQSGSISSPVLAGIKGWDTDFWSGKVYYTTPLAATPRLGVWDMRKNTIVSLSGAFPYTLLGVYSYVDVVGK